MKAKKIKVWAWLGQISFLILYVSNAILESTSLEYNTNTEKACVSLCLISFIVFSVAIVKIIGYFAEILEEKNKD